MNRLDNLKKISTISADTANIKYIKNYDVQRATTNLSLILKSPLFTTYAKLFEDTITYAQKLGGNKNTQITNTRNKLIVNIGTEILKNISGKVSTKIDSRLSFNIDLTIQKAHKIIQIYQEQNVDKSRVLIKITATWEGLQEAKKLEKSNIKCNLTLLFYFVQSCACAQKNIYLISPFIGHISNWYKKHNLFKENNTTNDPGIKSPKKNYYYYKKFQYTTMIMKASFRAIDQILAISGWNYLTVYPILLQKLYSNENYITRQLFSTKKHLSHRLPYISQSIFFLEFNKNKMAVNKLNENIHLVSIDQKKLNKLLLKQF